MHGEELRKHILSEVTLLGLIKEAKCLECGRDCEDGVDICPGCGEQLGSIKKDSATGKTSEKDERRILHQKITKKRAVEKKSIGYEEEV